MDKQDGQDLAVDLILRNAVVHSRARTTAVAITDGMIAKTGGDADVLESAGPRTDVIDCRGRTLIPGIVDAHCHLFATAATISRVDCRPSATPTVSAVIEALRTSQTGADGWIRGHGYDDSTLGLGRHLDRRDLDGVGLDAPVRVEHRSRHASVLNSAGLRAVGIGKNTPDPPGGVITRDDRGEPTGLLLEMAAWLRERFAERGGDELAGSHNALRELGQRLLAYGITAVTDAGPDNGPQRWRAFADAVEAGVFPQRVTMMAGHTRLAEMRDAGLQYGDTAGGGLLSLGHAKIMLTASSGRLHPHPDELSEMVAMAHRMGFPVAIHAVERDAVIAAALAIMDNPSSVGRDRIEHCGECPPDVAELVAQSGALAVPNTGFLHYDGERYMRTVSDELLPHLYPAGALDALDVPIALGSDAPVVEPNPWASLAAAINRRTAQGNHLGGVGLSSVARALDVHTGSYHIAPGCPADLAVVEPDPFAAPLDRLPEVRAVLTMVGGRAVWRSGI